MSQSTLSTAAIRLWNPGSSPTLATLALTTAALVLLAACGDKDEASERSGTVDADGDSYADIGDGGVDCDDQDDDIHPGADEVCDGIDNDCDGLVDDDDPDLDTSTGSAWRPDLDGDGYGDAAASPTLACAAPTGSGAWAADGTDCDDTDAGVNPGADEVCDPRDTDEDCSGHADDADPDVDASSGSTWYLDGDDDGHGDAADPGEVFCDDPSNSLLSYAETADDCDDSDDDISPSMSEQCDARDTDEDCDGLADDADPDVDLSEAELWFPDADEDGYGAFDSGGSLACDDPSSATSGTWLTDDSDCDDADASVNPGATEVCDEDDLDEDCSGAADDADPGVDLTGATVWYLDYDEDGYGDRDDAGTTACDEPGTGAVAYVEGDASDCDDTNADAWPGAWEDYTDGVDNDCDGNLDETWLESSSAAVLVSGGTASGYFGSEVVVGDYDGDGQLDLGVGSPSDEHAANNAGALHVFLGPFSAGSYDADANTWVQVNGTEADAKLGRAADLTADLDGDGYGELVGGAHGTDGDNGLAFVLHGPVSGVVDAHEADLVIAGEAEGKLGWFVAQAAGDLDDDGVDDLVFGEPLGASDAGVVYLFAGTATGSLSTADALLSITGPTDGYLGTNAAAEVDLDGDGVDDLILGSGNEDSLYVFLGPITADLEVSDASWSLTGSGTELGDEVGTGDFDGDGSTDLLVGDPSYDGEVNNGGIAYAFQGPLSSGLTVSDACFTMTSGDQGAALGDRWGAVRGGDLDGDGLDDLILGGRYVDSGANNSGHVGVALGPLSGTMDVEDADYNFSGVSSGDYLGNNLEVGDLDGDGLPDLATGALQFGSAGEAYLFLGSSL